jgi:GTP-binding protein HflX
VGYTNSGKSTIFNKLSLSDVLVKDMVFATLDTKMSSVNLGNKNQVILTDTVGFISALPTELINSFNSSLEELFSADFLLLVHDLSNPNIENQAHLVLETLKDIGFSEEELNQKIINIFNKSDIVSDIPDINTINKNKSIIISAFKGFGLEDLKNYMANEIITVTYLLDIFVPISFPDIYSWLFKNTYILSETNENIDFEGSKIRVDISSYQLNIFQGNYPNIKVNFI